MLGMTVLLLDIKKEDTEDTIYSSIENREIYFPVGTHYAVVLPYKNRNMCEGKGYSTHFNAHTAGLTAESFKKLGVKSVIINRKGECRYAIPTPNDPIQTEVEGEVFYCLNDNGQVVNCVVAQP